MRAQVPRRRLRIDLIPKPLHGENLRTKAEKHHWRKLRSTLLEDRSLACETCGGAVATTSELQGHENWTYYFGDWPAMSVLSGIAFVCRLCHSAEHFINTQLLAMEGKIDPEYVDRVIEHYCRVNRVSRKTFWKDLEKATARWKLLSELKWITHYGEYNDWLLDILTRRVAIIRRRNQLIQEREREKRASRRKRRT